MTPNTKALEKFLENDRLGRFLYPGFHEFHEQNAASTLARWNAATIYAHLLLWKPLIHALVNMSKWGAYGITLMRDSHPKLPADRWTLGYDELCAKYNENIPYLLEPLDLEDLDGKAKEPLTLESLEALWDWCQQDIGQQIAPLQCQSPPRFDTLRVL